MKKIQIFILISSVFLSSVSFSFADELITSSAPAQNPFECILTKWMIESHGVMDLSLLQLYMNDLSQACNPTGSLVGSTQGKTRYPGCDTDDIVLENGQVWAACNVGSSVAYSGSFDGTQNTPLASTLELGRFFQWGEMYGWDYDGGFTSSDNLLYHAMINGREGMPGEISDTEAGGVERWGITGTTQGPCENGYHVPSKSEWNESYYALETMPYNTEKVLRLPRSGTRSNIDGILYGFSTNGTYWSSTPNDVANQTSWVIDFTVQGSPLNTFDRNQLYPVRCIRDGTEMLNSVPEETGSDMEEVTSDSDTDDALLDDLLSDF